VNQVTFKNNASGIFSSENQIVWLRLFGWEMDHNYKNKALTKMSTNGIVCDCDLVLIKKKVKWSLTVGQI